MIAICLLIFSLCIGIILLSIHHQDEIHLLVAWLSGLIALICIFVLTPPLIKGLMGLLFFIGAPTFFPIHKTLR